jgi:GrpB-like predicted nucleotidyltransferase (UPF0157 family)
MVEVVAYRAEWVEQFDRLAAQYRAALVMSGVTFHSIEHVGSTSVPGLAAKPVLDVDIIVDESVVPGAIAAMESLGFVGRGELGVPGRFALAAPPRLGPTNTYIAVRGSLALRNHLIVRDVLRSDGGLREEYAAVKLRAAADADDIDEYIAMKSDVLGRILERGGMSAADRRSIAAVNAHITGRGAAG